MSFVMVTLFDLLSFCTLPPTMHITATMALPFTWCNSVPSMMHGVSGSLRPTQLSFSCPTPTLLKQKMGMSVLKWGVVKCIVGISLCYDSEKQLCDWPTKTWSGVSGVVGFFQDNNMCLHRQVSNVRTLSLSHKDIWTSTLHCKLLKNEQFTMRKIIIYYGWNPSASIYLEIVPL